MKEFFKLVFKFTGIMLIIVTIVIVAVWIFTKITGQNMEGTPFEVFTSKEKKTVLVAGLHPEGPLTDFIMVVQYNPKTKSVSGLSIPRDTKVIGTPDGKINSAYARKKDINDLKEKVKEVTSLSVDNYVIVDTATLIKIVDAIGGVPVNVPIDMKYDDFAQDLHIDIKQGQQTLSGAKAEEFIRFRKNNDGTGYPMGDLQRIQVEQEFIKATIKQALNAKNILKMPELINLAFKSVKTDVKLADVLKYAEDAKEFDMNNLTLETLPGAADYINGISYFVSNTTETKKLVEEMFSDDASGSGAAKITKATATIEVLNATDKQGLAAKVSEKLRDAGYNVTKIGNHSTSTNEQTMITDRTGKTTIAKDIKKIMGTGIIKTSEKAEGDTDITIFVGGDY